jgi:peptidyl-prolyl cis-trans isomerase SurA
MTYKFGARFLLALACSAFLASAVARAEILEQILVKVNGEIMTKTDLENRQVVALRLRGQQVDLKNATNQQLRKALDEITPRIMAEAVDEMILLQRGKELGYTLGDEQFKSILENIKKDNKFETEEQLQAALKSENLTMPDLRRNLERQMIIQRVEQNEVLGKVAVTDEEAQAYYQAHLGEFTTSPSITLREILVPLPNDPKGVNVGLDDAAREKAEQIRARIVAGETFEKVATEVSASPTKASGGLVGPINMNDLSPDLRAVIEPLKAGDVTEVLRTARGYQLLKVESSSPKQTLPFEQAREQISDRVFTGKRKEQLQKYLEKMRAQAIIEWKNDDIKRAYEEGLKQLTVAPA